MLVLGDDGPNTAVSRRLWQILRYGAAKAALLGLPFDVPAVMVPVGLLVDPTSS
jgi:hypothetical protein